MNNKHYVINIWVESLDEYLPVNRIFKTFEEAMNFAYDQGGRFRISKHERI